MAISDSIIQAESGGNALAEIFDAAYVFVELRVFRVVELLFVRCPAAISRFIVAGRINAINAMFWRGFRSHIGKKTLETCAPSFANLDASGSVISVTDILGARAPLFHRAPSPVLARLFHAVRLHGCPDNFLMKASAALGWGSFCQMALPYNGNVSAIAYAAISAPLPRLAAMREHLGIYFNINDKPSNTLSCQIEKHL